MVRKTRFDLEQEIMSCWQVTDDLNILYEYIGDHPFFTGMKAEHEDKIMNLLLGTKTMYEVKFDRLWQTFETLIEQNKEDGSYNNKL